MEKFLVVVCLLLSASACSDASETVALTTTQVPVTTTVAPITTQPPATTTLPSFELPSEGEDFDSVIELCSLASNSLQCEEDCFADKATLNECVAEAEEIATVSYIETKVLNYDSTIGTEPFLASDNWHPLDTDDYECWLETIIAELGIVGYEKFIQRLRVGSTSLTGGVLREDALRSTDAEVKCADLIKMEKENFTRSVKKYYEEMDIIFGDEEPLWPEDIWWVNCVTDKISEEEAAQLSVEFLVNGESEMLLLYEQTYRHHIDDCSEWNLERHCAGQSIGKCIFYKELDDGTLEWVD